MLISINHWKFNSICKKIMTIIRIYLLVMMSVARDFNLAASNAN